MNELSRHWRTNTRVLGCREDHSLKEKSRHLGRRNGGSNSYFVPPKIILNIKLLLLSTHLGRNFSEFPERPNQFLGQPLRRSSRIPRPIGELTPRSVKGPSGGPLRSRGRSDLTLLSQRSTR